jgi:hypothetical protein
MLQRFAHRPEWLDRAKHAGGQMWVELESKLLFRQIIIQNNSEVPNLKALREDQEARWIKGV